MDLKQHLIRQMVFSRATFGPSSRSEGVLDHIEREMKELRDEIAKPRDDSSQPCWAALEWVHLVILSLDGLTRELWAHGFYARPLDGNYKETADKVAEFAVELIMQKQARNERREWPDWRTADPKKAIEHVKGEGTK